MTHYYYGGGGEGTGGGRRVSHPNGHQPVFPPPSPPTFLDLPAWRPPLLYTHFPSPHGPSPTHSHPLALPSTPKA